MIARRIIYISILFLMTVAVSGQEDIKREVKLYNPFKPTLAKENKINFFPDLNDTSLVAPLFQYDITPRSFMPEYKIRTIRAARLEPDPLPMLYKSYLNVGFGNYFTPLGELSIASGRSRDKVIGFYLKHQSSFGSIKLDNDQEVFAGYMDNIMRMNGTKLFRRSALSGNLDFEHLRRYAYGYDPDRYPATYTEMDKDSLKIDYFNPGANINFYSTRLDSNHLDFDFTLLYDLLYQNADYYRHSGGAEFKGGYNLDIFYANALVGYRYYYYSPLIDDRMRHVISFDPSVNKSTSLWAFKVGFKLVTDTRNIFDDPNPPEYKTSLYFYPDVRFRFSIIPSFMSFFVSLDGDYENNDAAGIIKSNPYVITHDSIKGVIPSADLYLLNPTDNRLRVAGGLLGSVSEETTYRLIASYTLFEDMLFFQNDAYVSRGFLPVYDNGELLTLHGEIKGRINEKIGYSATVNYYKYEIETLEHPWNMPSWDGKMTFNYNLKDKIIANADIYGVSLRYGGNGTAIPSVSDVNELPVHFNLNLGLEYRYTKVLSFWTRLNNIGYNRYYELNFYPSQRFLFMAGFSYSL